MNLHIRPTPPPPEPADEPLAFKDCGGRGWKDLGNIHAKTPDRIVDFFAVGP